MSDEQSNKRVGGLPKLVWLLVILAIVVLWWYFRGNSEDSQARRDQRTEDYVAATQDTSLTDPDDILIDLKDDASAEAIQKDLGLTLVLVDNSGEAADTKLFRAHVDPAQRDAILAKLSARD